VSHRRQVLFALAILVWLASFAILRREGTWTQFAVAGLILATLAVVFDVVPGTLLRPSILRLGSGVVAGLLMIAVTRMAYTAAAALLPATQAATAELFAFLRIGGHSPVASATLIAVIASCEEIVFRGTLSDAHRRGDVARSALRLVLHAAAYALATMTLGSPLLVLCAFLCGVTWGALRLWTGSLVVPIVTHVVWDLGVLMIWPLIAAP